MNIINTIQKALNKSNENNYMLIKNKDKDTLNNIRCCIKYENITFDYNINEINEILKVDVIINKNNNTYINNVKCIIKRTYENDLLLKSIFYNNIRKS